jgi:hypothetical protein
LGSLETIREEAVTAYLRALSMEKLKKTLKNLSEDSHMSSAKFEPGMFRMQVRCVAA